MRIRSPSLPELHAFVAVVEGGSFGQAAERLSVTQGAVSRSVLRLEERLGVTLLDRRPAGVQATPTGALYYERIKPALQVLEDAVPAKSRAGSVKQELRITAISSLNMRWLVPRLPLFSARHPDIRLAFKPYRDRDGDFMRDDVDCWIQRRMDSKSRWPRHVRATYLIGRDIVPICHPSVAPSIRCSADLLRHPLLHHSGYPGNWVTWLKGQGAMPGPLELATGFDLAATLIEAVASNMGVAVVQPCLIERELAEGRVAVPLDSPVSTGRGYYFCVLRALEESAAMRSFREWVFEQAEASEKASTGVRDG